MPDIDNSVFGYVQIVNDLDLFILAIYTKTNKLSVGYPEKNWIKPVETVQVQLKFIWRRLLT
ncbi:MAG: hypothetical protein ACK5HT_21920 [Draconibacterium sp.]